MNDYNYNCKVRIFCIVPVVYTGIMKFKQTTPQCMLWWGSYDKTKSIISYNANLLWYISGSNNYH